MIMTVILKADEEPIKGTVVRDSKGRSIGQVLSSEPREDGKWSVLCEADVSETDKKNLGEYDYSIESKE